MPVAKERAGRERHAVWAIVAAGMSLKRIHATASGPRAARETAALLAGA